VNTPESIRAQRVIDDESTGRSVAEATAIDNPRVSVVQIPPSGAYATPPESRWLAQLIAVALHVSGSEGKADD
jgi:hypothetical protein